jgi:hypothetical protein
LPRLVVIDTQSLLDWLVFGNPACAGWDDRLRLDWKWVFTTDMRAEFNHVVAKGFGPRWSVRDERVGLAWSNLAHHVEPVTPRPAPSNSLRCTDPDDQMFIDLAIGMQADSLVTRDKALLRLARRAARLNGLRICVPASW